MTSFEQHLSAPKLALQLALIVNLHTSAYVSAEIFHVVPSKNISCDDKLPCTTLSKYAAQPNTYFSSNSTLIFHPGYHFLDMDFQIKDITNLAIHGDKNSKSSTITCRPSSKFMFAGIGHIYISGLVLVDCIGNTLTSIEQLDVQYISSIHIKDNCGAGFELKWIKSLSIFSSSFSIKSNKSCVSQDGQVMATAVLINSCNIVSIKNVLFDDITTTDNNTSILLFQNSSIIIDGSTFKNNILGALTGIMYVTDCAVAIQNSVFLNTTCFGSHCALYSIVILHSNVRIDDVSFYGTEAGHGAILLVLDSDVRIRNSFFAEITADIVITIVNATYYTTMTIENTMFINNNLTSVTVYIANSSARIDKCIFSESISQSVIALGSINSSVTLSNSTFMKNIGTNGYGLIRAYSSLLSIDNCTFMDNTANLYGILYVGDCSVNISNSAFYNNTVYQSGGTIKSMLSSHVAVRHSVFVSNTAMYHRGGALQADSSTISIEMSNFYDNRAIQGGAIHVLNTTLFVNACIFCFNKAYYLKVISNNIIGDSTATDELSVSGGSLFAYNSFLRIYGSRFINNTATAISESKILCDPISNAHQSSITLTLQAVGGAIFTKNSMIVMNSSEFENNSASIDYIDQTNNSICVLFNQSGVGGGAIRFENGTVNLHGSNFTLNRVHIGEVIFRKSLQIDRLKFETEIEAKNVSTTYNMSYSIPVYGYAISIFNSSSIEIGESLFCNNRANVIGMGAGAVFIWNGSFVQIISTTFSNNAAGRLDPQDGIYDNNTNCTSNEFGNIPSGALNIWMSSIVIGDSVFFNNTISLGGSAGTMLMSNVIISNSTFIKNRVDHGSLFSGTLLIYKSAIMMKNSTLFNNAGGVVIISALSNNSQNLMVSCSYMNNSANDLGGVVVVLNSHLLLINATFTHNSIGQLPLLKCYTLFDKISSARFLQDTVSGGALLSHKSIIEMKSCSFIHNTVPAIQIIKSNVTIICSIFDDNKAGSATDTSTVDIIGSLFVNHLCTRPSCFGLALYIFAESVTSVSNCTFRNNSGGAVNALGGTIVMSDCIFSNNKANTEGGAIYVDSVTFISTASLTITNNSARSTLLAVNSTLEVRGNITISKNNGPFYVFYSKFTFLGHTIFGDNTYYYNSSTPFYEYRSKYGGALTSFYSDIVFNCTVELTSNRAIAGAAILAKESKLYFVGNTTISRNSASLFGGGIYSSQSEINFLGITKIYDNFAAEWGGGIHVAGATMNFLQGSIEFANNSAKRGGAVSFDLNAKLHILKQQIECAKYVLHCGDRADSRKWLKLIFRNNTADYGGALFVSDKENFATCAAKDYSNVSDCFFQELALYPGYQNAIFKLNLCNTFFYNNTAIVSGGILYGGLIDRCAINPFAELLQRHEQLHIPTHVNALSYLVDYNVTNIRDYEIQSGISSEPVRVCFCNIGFPNCSYRPPILYVRKGERFTVSLVAVDQVNNTIPNTTIHSAVSSSAGLSEGQAIQISSIACTDFQYNVISPHDSEQVILYAEGPCKDSGISSTYFNVTFTVCPIGFIDSETECSCDPEIYPKYIRDCSIENHSVLRKDSIWITYINDTEQQGYLRYSHCPYDYCYPPTEEVWVNLNIPSGPDSQCANNRTGKLCGSCEDGLSLSLGSSQCKQCSNNWLVLFVPFSIVGVALVFFLLAFNMTIDKATLNAVIFYANVIGTNRSIFYPFKTPNVLSVFVAWINLDFGLETCFYDGMTGYAKTWLQLAFPLYIIFLVIIIIIGCEYSHTFHRLLYKRNPVAVLSTLILLSYTKFLRIIISSFSFARLAYPDDSHETVWLFDANVQYFGWKHALLFITALAVLVIGLPYTFFLFLWQWLQRCPNRWPFSWIRNTKLYSFMDAYQTPYNPKHRYWTGLLLLARVVLYLVSAMNVNHDPGINLLSIICVVSVLLLLRSNLTGSIYKQWPLNVLENSFLFNLVIFSAVTSYIREINGNQNILAYVSIGIAFCTFLGIVLYHFYKFTFHKRIQKLKQLLPFQKQSTAAAYLQPFLAESINNQPTYSEFDGLPDPIDTDSDGDHEQAESYASAEITPTEYHNQDESIKQEIIPDQPAGHVETCRYNASMIGHNTVSKVPVSDARSVNTQGHRIIVELNEFATST